MSRVPEPRTQAGRRLLWMFDLERNGVGRTLTRTFDARLTRRIVEEFIPRIEEEAWQNGPLTDEALEALDAEDARGGRQAYNPNAGAALPPADPTLLGKSSVPG